MATEETTITELELAEEVLADMVIPVDTSTDTKSVSLKQLRAWLGSSLPTGFIIASFGKMDDERFTLLDGKTLSKQGTYGAFCAKVEEQVQAGKWFACSEEEYNADILAYGQCGKFVIGTDYVRIPKLGNSLCSGVVDGKIPVVGNGMTLGLTDGSTNYGLATITAQNLLLGMTGAYGASAGKGSGGGSQIPTNNKFGITTDPTKSGIEGKINSVEVFYYMVISTEGQTAEVGIDINQVYEDLNLKANGDLSNVASVSQTFKEQSVGWGMPDYSSAVEITNGFVVPTNGYIFFGDYNGGRSVYVDDVRINSNKLTFSSYQSANEGSSYICFPVSKGDVFTYNSRGATTISQRFYPLKGVN